MLEKLIDEVWKANLDLVKYDLVTLTWGNVSGILRNEGLIVIKPSGVDYANLKKKDMVIIDLDGKPVRGNNRPSSDTPTHLLLYNKFSSIGGITHSHSRYATMFAQAFREIPCLGTTHADHFHGTIPMTRILDAEEVKENYELNTGKIIVERFQNLDPDKMPGVLVAGHGPFTWGTDATDSVKNNLILERVAELALGTLQLNPGQSPLAEYIQDKHHQRKHGPDAYYGQK